MGDQGAGSTMVEIAAARALQWNVDFDRGLRSSKPGAQCEAVMKLGPQLVRWSHNCVVTASSANLFKLEPGQDRVFANAILLRLADTFRSGNNFVRVCILKVLMLELKGRGWLGETFTGNNFEKILMTKKLTSRSSSHTPAMRRIRSREEGLLTKKRIENHAEMLRRVKSVVDSGDPTSRALAIRVLGCLADLGKDSVDVHNLVLQAVHSPHHQEVSAALFAMGCLSELSNEFAEHSLQKAFEMANAMETPPQLKVLAVRLFAKLGRSPVLSLQAFEMGRRLMLRYPVHEIVTTMLISLTMLASESSVIMGNQVDLLLTYIAHDPRMNVRAIALKCLSKLVPQAFCCMDTSNDVFDGVFAVVQDTAVPSTLHVLALRVIRKLFHQRVATMEFEHLLQIISWIELTALCDIWPVVSQALTLLVDMVSHFMKFKMNRESSEHRMELMEFSTRICFLLCDQVSITGALAVRSREVTLRQSGSLSKDEDMMRLTEVKVSTVCMLLVKLVQGYPPVGWHVVDSIAGLMETLAQGNLEQRKENIGKKGPEMKIDQESSIEDKDARQVQKDPTSVRLESVKATGSMSSEVNLIMTELGRCLSASVSFLEFKAKSIEDVHRRLHQLVNVLISVDTPLSLLKPVVQALMKANLAHDSLTPITDMQVGRGPKLEKLADSGKGAGESKMRLLVKSRSTLQRIGRKLIQGYSFWMAYEVGKDAALNGVWKLAQCTFNDLVDRVSSEGCFVWLRALSYQARAESVLQMGYYVDKGDNEQEEGQIDWSAGTGLVGENEAARGGDIFKESYISKGSGVHQSPQLEESSLGRLGKAAACAISLLQNSISCLSAGVCLERMFEFQRWVLSLRLEVLECISELVGLLAHISSLDTDAGVIDLEDEQKNNDMKSLGSALRASTEKIELLASRLKDLSEEYDLLAISFMGIDQESVGMLSRAALFCSLLAFCSVGVLSPPATSSCPSADSTLNVGALALDLFHRLQQIKSEDWDDLLSLAIQNGAGVINGQGFGGTVVTGLQEIALMNLSRWVITSVLGLQKQHSLVGIVRGTRLLQEILQECLNVPWLSPPFFFCTRPRAGVELFLAQAGANPGETEDLSVVQGSALALSVCLQIVNAPLESPLYFKRLECALSIQPAESTSKLGNEVHMGTKAGFMANQTLRLSVIEKLILHAKVPMVSNFSPGWGNTTTKCQSTLDKTTEIAPDLLFSVPVDSKGQGFASCTFDVSQVPCGEYQLILSCICMDNSSGQWILPLLNPGPNFRII